MQTSEYRHLAKREKKALGNPGNRKHLKRACACMHEVIGSLKASKSETADTVLAERKAICLRLRKKAV